MNHLMERDGSSHGAVAATHDRIAQAVAALVAEEHPATISVPAVARRAGVSVATVYRYFPNKEQLLDAAAEIGNQETSAAFGDQAITDDLVDDLISRSFWELADHLPLVRNQQHSAAGRDL